ncbi:MAG: DUF167 domain-containing protein [Mariprofundaceae bacterium]|nr:DUF167 domain-containing protein [Mariprofundaceae bacterium]
MSDVDSAITVAKNGLYVNVHAQPGACKPSLRGMHGDALKIAVREAAQDGKANAAIVDFMAGALGCGKRQVEVASGHASRRKRLFISGDTALIANRLRQLVADV